MSDRFGEIAAFVEVARQLSFVRAAEQLDVNVSAVSRAVAALEARLGVRLLQRSTRRVGLSEAGRAHFARCEALLAELAEAEAATSERASALGGSLRASVPSGFGLTHLAPMLPEFLRRHPRLTLELEMSNRFVDLIEEGYDVAIRVGTLRDSRLAARKLGANRRVLVAAPGYLAGRAPLRHPRELAEHPCLVLDIGVHPDVWPLVSRDARHSARVSGPLRSNHVLAVRAAAAAGLGIALLPTFALAESLADGSLVRVLPRWQTPEQGIYAVYPTHRLIPAKVRAFVDFIEARLRGARAE
ncbi:MAG TPA: LysR family transcriptional regulator [Rudaea sp.]|nr:LysR family transcriptional regulator [Rudaea sp.]